MKISQAKFEQELDALITAALSASSEETARRYLLEADNKIDAYDIEPHLQKEYRQRIFNAKRKIELKW